METKIKTYRDLEREKIRLESLLSERSALVKQDFARFKEEMKPVKAVLGFASKFISKDKTNPLVGLGLDFFGDVFLKNLLFRKAGIFTKVLAPFLIKNFSSHVLSGKDDMNIVHQIAEKIGQVKSFFSKKETKNLRPVRYPNNI